MPHPLPFSSKVKWILLGAALGLALPAAGQQKKPLAIVNAALLEAEDGFAARADTIYLGGETLYLAFHIQGYTVTRANRVKLSYRIDALDFNGIPFVEPDQGTIDTELAPQDAKWLPRVRFSPTLPLFVDSGQYKFVIAVTDELAKTQVSQEVPFQIRGRNVPASTELAVHNFEFSRREDGDALPAPAYRRGDVLWASFDIVGYKIEAQNLLSVEYTLAVFNAAGEKVFEQPEPAQEKGTSFYPRRYVHAVFSLSLERSAPGEYTIALAVRDLQGRQTHESRHVFTVE